MLTVLGPIIAIFLMTGAVALSNILGNLFPRISTSYFNIALGISIALIPALNHIIPAFNFEIFMLTISPLLFFEGQSTTSANIFRNLGAIFSVSGVLVLVTMLVVGGLLQLLPGISLGLGLVLAVISAPTDATALETASAGVQLSSSDEKTLKFEGLFNDATGLVLLEVALLVLQGSKVSVGDSVLTFIRSAGGGIVFGIMAGIAIIVIRQLLIRLQFNLSLPITLVYILSPFAAFLGAEALGFSGILAVVTTGIVGNAEIKHVRLMSPRQSRWGIDLFEVLLELLNGVAFASLGMLATRIIMKNWHELGNSLIWIVLGVVLYLGCLATRYLYIKFTMKKTPHAALVFAVGGVHGAVNFALALSISEYGLANTTFELIVMAEVTFILLSMLVPPIIFKVVLPAKPSAQLKRIQSATIKRAMVDDVIAISQVTELPVRVRDSVIQDLNSQTGRLSFAGIISNWRQTATIIHDLSDEEQLQRRSALRAAFQHERDYLQQRSAQSPEQTSIIEELYNEVLLAESVVIDLPVT